MRQIETSPLARLGIQDVGSPRSSAGPFLCRPNASGKFLFLGNEKLWVYGATYGTFRPTDGVEYPRLEVVESDFAQIAANGLNAIRTYTAPPRWLLDAAQRHRLWVLVGLPWEEHITFLDDWRRARSIAERVRAGVRTCAGHPAILCYAVGNEIPASIVRWHGPRRVERYIERLYRAVKAEDPDALVTYVNYPTTEYLQLPFLDLACFNVFLESQASAEAYLARLHNVAGDKPLIITEIGLDSRRHGEDAQAQTLDWQVRTAFAAGCAGAFVFAWTDEWHRGGYDIEDWDFGLTDRARRSKPALTAIRNAAADVPFPPDVPWPRISVAVCSHNGARGIRGTLEGLRKQQYPHFEVIVVDDGSTDRTAAIAKEYGVQVISTQNHGLAAARNTGLAAATGEIIAYIDDDACPDVHWLTYLAATFLTTTHAAVGGPNIAPPGDGLVADCVANAPGGPIHVLLSDREAEHLPGCNMAFRAAVLRAVGGFDPQFCVAGDDVDVCWRLRDQGWTLGFCPAAVVWHHRRHSVRAYWRQQRGYGKAEALLERKWPQKYNAAGHITWAGRLYGTGIPETLGWQKRRIFHGTWGGALFQSVYHPSPGTFWALPMMPEWYLVIAALASLSALGSLWKPFLYALPFLALAVLASLAQAWLNAARAPLRWAPGTAILRLKLRALVGFLYLVQPLARLSGRLQNGLGPWRRRGMRGFSFPWPRTLAIWSEGWQPFDERLQTLEAVLQTHRAVVLRGGDCDRWDLEVRDGTLGGVRILMAIEEHGAGKQLVRFRAWPRCSAWGVALILLSAAVSALAALDRAWAGSSVLAAIATLLALRMLHECAAATGAVCRVLAQPEMDAARRPLRDNTALLLSRSSSSLTGSMTKGRRVAGS